MRKSFPTFKPRALSPLFIYAVMAFSQAPAIAQESSYSAEDYRDGALRGAFEVADIFFLSDPSAFAESQYPKKSKSYYQGFVAGAECTNEVASKMAIRMNLVIENPSAEQGYEQNPKIEDINQVFKNIEPIYFNAAGICQEAFIARYNMGL